MGYTYLYVTRFLRHHPRFIVQEYDSFYKVKTIIPCELVFV